MRKQVLADWGAELPGLPLNCFADELPAAYLRDQTGMSPGDFSVLRRCEVRAKIRRGCLAGAVACIRDVIAASTPEGREPECEWGLPVAFRARYDRDFHRRMLALSISLWERMESGTFTVPWCTAEEILLGIILGDYACRLRSVELDPGSVDLDGLWLQDDDYLLLYSTEIAAREDVLKALSKGPFFAVNLDFASWFNPFNKAYPVPGPTSESELRRINTPR